MESEFRALVRKENRFMEALKSAGYTSQGRGTNGKLAVMDTNGNMGHYDSFEDAHNHLLSSPKVIISDEAGKRRVISGKEYGDMLSENIKL